MSASTIFTNLTRGAGPARWLRGLGRMADALRRRLDVRAAERALSELDDRSLHDMGVSRHDIRAVVYGVRDETMRRGIRAKCGALALAAALALAGCDDDANAEDALTRGRYLVTIGGCNDCHTPRYAQREGRVPEAEWLVGDAVGFSGPWGTTYPSNLRRTLAGLTEDGWVEYVARLEARPPMPWFNLRAMREGDLRALYRYVRSLPPSDAAVPDFVPPGAAPQTPFIVMAPQPPQ